MLDNYACQPLNNAGCLPGTKCAYVSDGEGYEFNCLAFDPNPPKQWGEEGCFNGAPLDQACDVGLLCTRGQITNQCDLGACCTYWCDLTDPNFECKTPGDSCEPWFDTMAPPGMGTLGFCGVL